MKNNYLKKFEKYENKYFELIGSAGPGRLRDGPADSNYRPSRNLDRIRLPSTQPSTQSIFFMPIISEAYLIEFMYDAFVPQNILDAGGYLINTGLINQELYNTYVVLLSNYLNKNEPLLINLDQQFQEDQIPNESNIGHIDGRKQEDLLKKIKILPENVPDFIRDFTSDESMQLNMLDIFSEIINAHYASGGPVRSRGAPAEPRLDSGPGRSRGAPAEPRLDSGPGQSRGAPAEPIFRLKEVSPDGDCGFHSLFEALKHHNLEPYFKKKLEEKYGHKYDSDYSCNFSYTMRLLISENLNLSDIEVAFNLYITQSDFYKYEYQISEVSNLSDLFPAFGEVENPEQFLEFVKQRLLRPPDRDYDQWIYPNSLILDKLKYLVDDIFRNLKISIDASLRVELIFLPNREFIGSNEVKIRDYNSNNIYITKVAIGAHYNAILTDRIIDYQGLDESKALLKVKVNGNTLYFNIKNRSSTVNDSAYKSLNPEEKERVKIIFKNYIKLR
jgi:hypothetical protein